MKTIVSFIDNKHLTYSPEEVGHWWFYGYRYGKNEPTIEEAKFIPATLPELPES